MDHQNPLPLAQTTGKATQGGQKPSLEANLDLMNPV